MYWAKTIQSTFPQLISWKHILLLSPPCICFHVIFQVPKLCPIFVATKNQVWSEAKCLVVSQHNSFLKLSVLAYRPTPNLEDQTISAARDCLFSTLGSTLHIGRRSTTRNFRMQHAMWCGRKYHSQFLANVKIQVNVKQSDYRTGKTQCVPRGWASHISINRQKKVARLSVIRTGRLYPPGIIPGIHFC
jgi:hypothetical protein